MSWLAVVALLVCPPPVDLHHFEIAATRDYQVAGLPLDLTVTAATAEGKAVAAFCGTVVVTGVEKDGEPVTELSGFVGGKATLSGVTVVGDAVTAALPGDASAQPRGPPAATYRPELRQVPGFLSIVPPLLAVILAIMLRQAMLALFAGIWVGAMVIHGYNPLTALLRCFDTYLPVTFTDKGHADLICFTMALGGMVGVIAKSGGTRALVDAISARASNRRSGMVATWLAGMLVFFDDYANCLLVGNTIRPLTDKMRISREKLAYIVDSTAAPISTIALVSTWIGYQIGLLEGVFGAGTGYDKFLELLPYSFYSFFTIAFVFAVAVTLRDFGSMARAERRALDGEVLAPGANPLMDRELTEMQPDAPERASLWTAVIPVVSVIVIVAVGLYANGVSALGEAAEDAGLREIIAAADSYAALLWASFGGSVVAVVLAVARRTVSLIGAIDAWVAGIKSMVIAVLILILAWGLGDMCKDHLLTGPWILSQVAPSAHLLPMITFVVSALIALATGSSFSTMAIVIPIAGPMAIALTGDGSGMDPALVDPITYATLAAVLSGAVYGDHCSPISDTTVMASMSSACDHVDHVRTQAPYATLCAGVAAVIGYLPAGYGVSPLITVPVGIITLVVILRFLGRKTGTHANDSA